MNKNELAAQMADMAAQMNTIALAIYDIQGEPKPKAFLEDIAKTTKNVAGQCERLKEYLEEV